MGPAQYISHLDLQRTVDRALRRSNVPVLYSEGFNPHIKMSFAFALKVGMTSLAEYLEVEVADDADIQTIESAIKESFPIGLDVNWVRKKKENTKKLMASVAKAEYIVALENTSALEKLVSVIPDVLAQDTLLLTKQTKKGPKEFEARPLIDAVEAEADSASITLLLGAQEQGNLGSTTPNGKILPCRRFRYRVYYY